MEKYIVQSGDSLWKISRSLKIDINELTSINGLDTKAKQHIIHPGQILNIPSKDIIYDTQLNLKIYDLVWRPLSEAKLKLTFDDKTEEYITDSTGSVMGLLIEDSRKGIKVELQHLNQKKYITIAYHKRLPIGVKTLKISSREMVIKGSTSVEKGTQQSSKQQEQDSAKKAEEMPVINQQTRTEGGAPTNVSNIGNVSEGLRLPPVAEKYRNYIISSAKKYSFKPEGFAALIEAETSWVENAGNNKTTARGLGQFISNTWLSYSTNPASKIYQHLTKTYGYNNLEYIKKTGAFSGVLSDGNKEELNADTILSFRDNAEYSIDMIGLYDREIINNLTRKIPSINELTPDQLIMVAYLCHHNGEAGAYDLIFNGEGTLKYYRREYTDLDYSNKLNKGLGDKERERYLSIDNTSRTAYIAWIIDRYDSVIIPDHFRLKPTGEVLSLKEILKSLNPNIKINNAIPSVKDNEYKKQVSINLKSENKGGKWSNPLRVCKIRTYGLLSSKSASFGKNVRTDAQGNPRAHQGIDIAAEPGTTIFAVADGRIAFIIDPAHGDYGKQICIIVQVSDLPESKAALCEYKGQPLTSIFFFYSHLSEVSSNLSSNSLIRCGDKLGKTGNTGNAHAMTSIKLGAHLHFEVRTKALTGKGISERIDPAFFIDEFDYPPVKDRK
jgi:murein DD-endopeptidase MepM/ murein hydrolase activator NlpD